MRDDREPERGCPGGDVLADVTEADQPEDGARGFPAEELVALVGRVRDRVWSKLAVPCASGRRWLAATKKRPPAAVQIKAVTMPVGPESVNDGPGARLIWRKHGG